MAMIDKHLALQELPGPSTLGSRSCRPIKLINILLRYSWALTILYPLLHLQLCDAQITGAAKVSF